MPDAPLTLVNDATVTDETQIKFSWSDGAYDGGSSIIDYTVLYDQGTSTWIYLATGISVKEYTATSLTADTIYSFKVQAKNIVGFSVESTLVAIRAAAVPDTPTEPSTTLAGTNVIIDFT